jgi:hypothetical protein
MTAEFARLVRGLPAPFGTAARTERVCPVADRPEAGAVDTVTYRLRDLWGEAMASPHPVNDPEHWLRRAEEMRTLVKSIKDNTTKQTMLRIAADYERLATRAEDRAKGTQPG